jgi:hypothetical protein
VWVRKPDRREHFRVFGEEFGVGEQIFGDFAIVHGFG